MRNGFLNAATLLFARQPLAHARGSEQSRDRQGADAQSFMTLCLFGNILAEVEAGANRDAEREAAILQHIVEQVIVNQVGLRAQREMVGENDVETAAESIETSPIPFLSGGRQFM